MDRRTFAKAAAGAALAGASGVLTTTSPAVASPSTDPNEPQATPKSLKVAMIVYDGMTNLDFVGPHDVLSRIPTARIDVLGKTTSFVTTDANLRVLPGKALKDADAAYDMLFVPGGPATIAMIEDAEVLGFLRSRSGTATYITSVCTGALALGAAGLLDGYKAATHWATMDLLPLFGAIPTKQRVVVDRNRITGGGVTAGVDFGFTIVAQVWGEEMARMIQLGMEYDPKPPFVGGSPDKTSPELVARFRRMAGTFNTDLRSAAERAAPKRRG